MNTALSTGPVRVVGTGLLGGSLALALSTQGIEVHLEDVSPGVEALAADLGAGTVVPRGDGAPRLVVVAAPPDVAGALAADLLTAYPDAIVTDVASVKTKPLADVRARVRDQKGLARYVGSHPMAGRELSGVAAARADLFVGRPWVIVPHEATSAAAVRTVRALATDVGAVPVDETPEHHDAAVAVVSHVPQIVSSLLAARLAAADEPSLGLAGQGVRDVTRLAAGDPRLWVEILAGNAGAAAPVLRALRDDLDAVTGALESLAGDPVPATGSRAALARMMVAGNTGAARLPGKHGGRAAAYAQVTVLVPDTPGELARLLTEVGEIGVNLEDLRLEHSLGQKAGLATLMVLPQRAASLEDDLTARGWRLASAGA